MALAWNLHTHTARCKHAEGDVLAYAQHAAAAGMHTLGIADHTPWVDGRWDGVRMHLDELDGYLAAIDAAAAAVPSVRLLRGLEAELVPEHAAWLHDDVLIGKQLDYLIAAVHYLPPTDGRDRTDGANWDGAFSHSNGPEGLKRYIAQAEVTLGSGLFCLLAHPDVFGVCNEHFDADCVAASHDLCQLAVDAGIALELNAYGLRKPQRFGRAGYPWRPFWEIVSEYPVTVAISSDAHDPRDTSHGAELNRWIDELDLERADLGALVPNAVSTDTDAT